MNAPQPSLTALLRDGLRTGAATLWIDDEGAMDRPWTLTPSLEATLALLALAVLSTALASVIFFRLIRTLGPVTTTSNAYLRALVSVAFGVVFLAEPLSWSLLAASALIVAGVMLVTLPGRPDRELRRAG